MHYHDFIPITFQDVIQKNRGKAGLEWYQTLPQILQDACVKWQLTPIKAFSNLSYNYVCLVQQQSGNNAVLKIGFPDKEFLTEVAALQLFGGTVSTKVLELDESNFFLLMEAAVPAKPLHSLANDAKETEIVAQLMKQLWKPVPTNHRFPTTADWSQGLKQVRDKYGDYGPFPKDLIEKAVAIFDDFHVHPRSYKVLHGDLHHDNVLSSQRQPWIIVDPKGVVGEPEYEIGAFIRNPFGRIKETADLEPLLDKRLNIFRDNLRFEKERMKQWAFAQAVLAAWWSIESLTEPNEGFNQYIRVAKALRM